MFESLLIGYNGCKCQNEFKLIINLRYMSVKARN
nr:MAG TPA: hypothetical protein [Caudoviricetes sp.]